MGKDIMFFFIYKVFFKRVFESYQYESGKKT